MVWPKTFTTIYDFWQMIEFPIYKDNLKAKSKYLWSVDFGQIFVPIVQDFY
jgi:hypothetical protein